MYSGVLIHAAWPVSSEGLGVRSRNSHGRGVPVEEVFRAAVLCPGFHGVDESPALHHHCPVDYWYREPSEGPWAIAKGKEGVTSSWLSVCLQGATWGSEMLFGSSPTGGLCMFTPSLAGRQLGAENHFCWVGGGRGKSFSRCPFFAGLLTNSRGPIS